MMSKIKSQTYLSLLLLATAFAVSVRLFLVEDFRVTSDSMKPSLLAGDLVLVFKPAYSLHLPFSNYELFRYLKPQLADVVAFTLPEEGMNTYIKRVIALEDDIVEIKEGTIWVNDTPLQYSTGAPRTETLGNGLSYPIEWAMTPKKHFGPIHVPKDHFFALGDSRDSSIDSRVWGPIPLSCLKGRVFLVWLSVGEKGGFRWRGQTSFSTKTDLATRRAQ